jgi:SHS2 domain-containing protein
MNAPLVRQTQSCCGADHHLIGSTIFLYFQGTEVKAITYASMQIYDNEDKHEVFVIVDI